MVESSKQSLEVIYRTLDKYAELPENKTIDKAEVCTMLGNLTFELGDLDQALLFFKEGFKMTRGEIAKRDIESAINHIEGRRTADYGNKRLEDQLAANLDDEDDNIVEHQAAQR
jgi:hypothetical protein